MAKDCDMIEINPLVLSKDKKVLAADSKITIDDNAAYRQEALAKSEDRSQLNEQERIAKQFDLNYIHIGGNIGCLVNGAGLAMSTMDIIKLYGGEPANKQHKFSKPIVLRLKGTKSDVAKEMIAGREKELGIFYNEDFDSAAQQVCKIVTGKK